MNRLIRNGTELAPNAVAPRRFSVGIVHPRMGRGGSEAVVMWGVEALKRDFDVSIVTTNSIDLAAVNLFYGTAVREDEVKLRQLPMPPILSRIRSGAAIRGALFMRGMRRVAREYDVLFSAYNPIDCGVPAIHLLDLCSDEELQTRFAPRPRGFQGLFHRIAPVRAIYLWVARRIASPSGRDLFSGEDIPLANSLWVASIIERKHGVRCAVLYPPAPGRFSDAPFESRNDDFACIGRVSEEKRLERVFEILGRVRARGHQVRLRMIGGFGTNRYERKIQALARRLPWVTTEGSVSEQRKQEILSSCRYGIHGAEGEGFGIAVAEMVKAGCITFAPADGGPSDILDHEGLLYRGADDAVEKICAVLSRPALQASLLEHLRQQAGKFSAERFMRELRTIVDTFLTDDSSGLKTSRQAVEGAL